MRDFDYLAASAFTQGIRANIAYPAESSVWPPRVLTIAGSDSGGGAGIQADLKTCQELGVFGMSAITAVTSQNSRGVHAVYPMPEEAILSQMDAVLGDIGAHAAKTGMLYSKDIVKAVASKLDDYGVRKLVVDPVLVAKDGSPLFRRDAVNALREDLLPRALVVTPNLPEACELLGVEEGTIRSVSDMMEAANMLLRFGSKYVLLKGGHLEDEAFRGLAIDVLAGGDGTAGMQPLTLSGPRIATRHTHGTGCSTAAAIAAYLARGFEMEHAAREAKCFVAAAIARAVPLGGGIGSLWHAAHREPAHGLQ
ncbi:bifunctional hydroxymethylpyrimidine kinase/phosphomethylpyrimidine kinase [Paenibacillus methanolicus]|uniref:Hydroxymethylpyrimidine/phosphomethylpyrimidine kinase n=1 Tax=Paenibacillus methanolicus TaxID=582686 RepID=A0A5S5BRK2_9BACL|nr:bifunctional hydroxymethylpyrimidine kinase/phosphomethylpyrimidine kinase [Paenibacillus methanolicus]TYP69835.1 hydroxymethylpyrimidine/phosphomethylpyrimidine kinase [Paenibacillus methanolicus]